MPAVMNARELRDQAWQERNAAHVERMGQPVQQDRVQSLIGQHLEDVARRRVFLEDHVDVVGPDRPPALKRSDALWRVIAPFEVVAVSGCPALLAMARLILW